MPVGSTLETRTHKPSPPQIASSPPVVMSDGASRGEKEVYATVADCGRSATAWAISALPDPASLARLLDRLHGRQPERDHRAPFFENRGKLLILDPQSVWTDVQ